MILILSNQTDQSTNRVIDWIVYKGYRFERINSDDLYFFNNFFTIEMNSDAKIIFKEPDYNIKTVWLRRWFNLSLNFNSSNDKDENNLQRAVNISLNEEFQSLSQFFFKHFANKKWLTNPETFWINKLHVLKMAQNCGFNIPNTIVTNKKEQIDLFLEKYYRIITKPISEVIMFSYKENLYSSLTREITKVELDTLDEIPMSLFQELLDIDYEIRTFYLDGKCFSMAMYSSHKFTVYDTKFIRHTAFTFPLEFEFKIVELMTKLNLTTGSLDFIKTKGGKFIFLEINPVGQFSQVSYPCNYFIEEKIANFLIS